MAAGKPSKIIARRLWKRALNEWLEHIAACDLEELYQIADDPHAPAYQRITAKAMASAVVDGNLAAFGWFLDRMYGKPAQQLTIDGEVTHKIEEYKSMTTKQLIAAFQDKVALLGDGKNEKSK